MATIIMTETQLRDFGRQVIQDFIDATRKGTMPPAEGQLITTKEALTRLNVSRPTLDRLAEDGEIKRVKVRGSWRYTTASIEQYLAS